MRYAAVAFLAGAIFAVGLALSGMTDPAKVTAFLDVTGRWDPRLALVMGAAIAVYLPGYFLVRRHRRTPLLDDRFHVPAMAPIDAQLVGGAAVFGIGWGLVGLCPGPALVSLGALGPHAWLFVAGMVLAMFVHGQLRARAAATIAAGAP